MNIDTKLQEFSQSLQQIADKEYRQIEKNVNEEIKKGIEQEIKEYEEKKQVNYEKNRLRIEKDYNKKLFNYEMQCKKEIIEEGKKIKQQIKKEAIDRVKELIKTDRYQEFLCKCIEERVSNCFR